MSTRAGGLAIVCGALLSGADTHNGFLGGVVIGVAAEHLDPDGALLQIVRIAAAVFHHVAQEALTLIALAECGAGQNSVQSLLHAGRFNQGERRRIVRLRGHF